MIPGTARWLALAAVCMGIAVPLQSASAGCGLAPRPAPGHKHVRSGDLHNGVRLYGDSITFQAWRRLVRLHPALGVDAFWGRATAATVDTLLADARGYPPRTVVLAVGTNDIGRPDAFLAQVRRARDLLPPTTRLVWVLVYDDYRPGWRDIDVRVAAVPGVQVVDWVTPNVAARGTGARSPLLSDGTHLSCQGADAWVRMMDQALSGVPQKAQLRRISDSETHRPADDEDPDETRTQ